MRTEDELRDVAEDLRDQLKPSTRWHKGRPHFRVFLCSDAVDLLISERYASDRAEAVRLGQQLQAAGLVVHDCRANKTFCDKASTFRFGEIPPVAEVIEEVALTPPRASRAATPGDKSGGKSGGKSPPFRPAPRRLPSLEDDQAAQPPPPPPPGVMSPRRPLQRSLSGMPMALAPHYEVQRLRHDAGRLRSQRRRAEYETRAWRLGCSVLLSALLFQVGGWQAGVTSLPVVGVTAYGLATSTDVHSDDEDATPRASCAEGTRPPLLQRQTSSFRASSRSIGYTQDRVARLRGGLKEDFPDLDDEIYSDAYLDSVLSVPDKKKPTQPRSVNYALQKLKDAVHWRRNMTIPPMDKLDRVMRSGSLYWHGYDNQGRPVLWVHPARKDYANFDLQEELDMHSLMLEYAVKNLLSADATQFCVCPNTNGMGLWDVRPSMMKGILKLITTSYPDRLGALYAGPVNPALKMIVNFMGTLMPAHLMSKVNICSNPREDLRDVLALPPSSRENGAQGDAAAIPDFFGGEMDHSSIFNEDGSFSFEKMHTFMMVNHPGGPRSTAMPAIVAGR